MALLTQNSKMVRSTGRIFNFGMPALKTCPMSGVCGTGCFATQGFYNMPAVKAAYDRRWQASKLEFFPDMMNEEIAHRRPDMVRVHDSGDFYSISYARKWVRIASENPTVHFYAYTKMVSLTRKLEWPANFTFIYSYGGKEDHLIDDSKMRHSRVFESLKALKNAGYIDASHDDTKAWKSKTNKIGLVYHGAKGRNKF